MSAAPTADTQRTYARRGVPQVYDVLITALFAPFGGIGSIRRAAVAHLAPVRDTRVLELGCGTGGLTRLLLARGAAVTAVDMSANMLRRARRRAPGANFVLQDLASLSLEPAGYAAVLAAFVLHELTPGARAAALARAFDTLVPGGRIVIVDHAVPVHGLVARAWRSLLLRLEPPSVRDTITRGYTAELLGAGFTDVDEHPLATGTARLWVARRP